MIIGFFIGGISEKIVKILEDVGVLVVVYEFCGVIRLNDLLVDEEIEDVYDVLI